MIAEMSKPTPKLANASPKNKTAVAGSKKTAKEEGAILNRGIQDPPLFGGDGLWEDLHHG